MSGSTGRLARSCVLFLGGIAVQVVILVFALPSKAQDDVFPLDPLPSHFGIVITQTGVANTGHTDVYNTSYAIALRDPITQTTSWAGVLSGAQAEIIGVESSRGAAVRTGTGYTLDGADLGFPPLFITVTVQSLEKGSQNLDLRGIVITDTVFAVPTVESSVLAADPPLPFTLGYRFPAVIPAGVITDTFRIDRRSRGVAVENVQVVGEMARGGIYRSVAFDGISCDAFSDTRFSCFADTLPVLGAVITITLEALEPGTTERFLDVAAGEEESLNVAFLTTVQRSFLPVTIDIQPGDAVGAIRHGRPGRIPVAIYSTPEFNTVAEINPMTLTFGRTGDENSWIACNSEDVNGDGLVDLICFFDPRAAGFQVGDTEGILKGQTYSGEDVQGSDAVRIVPPPL
jgi:hypothetical protein